jgi:hypothetical protein
VTAGESGAAVVLPPLTGELDVLWELILDLAEHLPESDWVLVGGQMVMLHALAAGRAPTRVSKDVDVLADLVSAPASLADCVEALQRLDLAPEPDSAGKVYPFRRDRDNATVDLLAPDHSPPRSPLRTVGGDTIRVEGGTQALRRALPLRVWKGERSAIVPVPGVLGALVLKAAAWIADSRDPERHSGDAFLTSLISDPVAERGSLAGSDRKRLLRLDKVLGDPDAVEWRRLGETAGDAYTTWPLLLS